MPIVTLTSDIGLEDYLVAAVKGQLYSVLEQVNIVDISHQLSSFNYPQAAYFCCSAFKYFPKNTFHMVLVNMFDEKPKQMLLAYHNQQYIACADNGLLTMILDGTPEYVVGLPLPAGEPPTTLTCTATIIAAYQQLLQGKSLDAIGDPGVAIVEKLRLKYVTSPTTMEGQILYIDNFENVIVNITRSDFEKERNGRNFKIVFKRDEVIDSISESYACVPQGEKVAYFNSAGYLEIAINKGNAAGLFGLQGFSEAMQKQSMSLQNKWFYQTVKIFFE
ncbi:SAM hydrolase/SAM-dependent halogenase family protein [Aridibaculum aurantiacum]|uniref:SAM hydrolase/SAM-dependent halogenase family protein n=1 Tax=Aridibaculum aurantiacum TaxID=2810307 RepID=UPI001A977352|nr:SAM-dependent chlorinase/fluorinase [Aridibaculum aurantiacum]